MSTYFKEIKIQNYKCFENETISLNVPDGENIGSGLNILIGENGNGKTTILEAINYLTLNSFSAENKIKINDFNDHNNKIIIEGESNEFECKSSIDFLRTHKFISKGIMFDAICRDRKEPGKVLSSPFSTHSKFILSFNEYIKENGDKKPNVDSRDINFSNSRIKNKEQFNIFYFDKNRTRQISTGTFKTTFEKICDDLNWTFVKNLNEENINELKKSISGEFFKTVEKITDKKVGKKTTDDLCEFFQDEKYKNIKIDLLSLLHPFTNGFFTHRNEDDLKQIKISSLGSGIETIMTILLLKNIADASKGNVIYLIDEPELHLHPKAQKTFLEILLDESKTKQIIISTHSPYMFQSAILKNAKLLLLTKDSENKITIIDTDDKKWGTFPWSPSWGEVNYFAYDLATVEYHNELYGYLHELYINNAKDVKEEKQRIRMSEFEKNFLQEKLTSTKEWEFEQAGKSKNIENLTLPTFIRNKIHHPENTKMQEFDYTDLELRNSIEKLQELVQKME